MLRVSKKKTDMQWQFLGTSFLMILNQLCLISNIVWIPKKPLILRHHLFSSVCSRKNLVTHWMWVHNQRNWMFFGYIQNNGSVTQNKLLNRNSIIVGTLIYVIVLFVWWENFPLWQQLLELHFGLWTSFKSAKRSIYSRKTLQCSGVALQNGVN